MSRNDLERKMRIDDLWNGVRNALWAVFWTGAVCFALGIINYLEQMAW